MMIRRVHIICLAIILAAQLSAPLPVWATSNGSVDFEKSREIAGQPFILMGAGLKTFLRIKVVAVGLYAPDGVESEEILEDVPKGLDVIYLQNIPKVELQKATTKGIARNYSKEELEPLEERLEIINSYWPDVTKGDRISFNYIPGIGSDIAVNGVKRGRIQGADFAQAFFSIWIGERPVDERIKRKLLGEV